MWVPGADLAAAFDRIGHGHLLSQLGTFPARELVAGWLTAGVVEDGRFTPTGEGTPQGGVVSPAPLNVALHGTEHAAGVRYQRAGSDAAFAVPGSPVLIRYADDLVAFCHTRQQAEQARARLASWLAPRGLAFNEDKTRIVTLDQGSGFLGFNIRQYRGRLLIKPGKAAVKRIRERLRAELRSLRGTSAQAVIARLNPIIRGWPACYRTVVSSEVFAALDHYPWKLTCKWPGIATRISRPGGSSAATSASSASPGTASGYPATATAAPTCSGSPGRKSSGTRWSGAPRLPTTPPWHCTGPAGAVKDPASGTSPARACCRRNMAGAPSARSCCPAPTARPKARASGSSG
jgi:hypothetical protein